MNEKLIEMLKQHEGFRGYPYHDTKGFRTVGYGRNLDANPFTIDEKHSLGLNSGRTLENQPLTPAEGEYLMRIDLSKAEGQLRDEFPIVRCVSDVRYCALLDMCFNMGIGSLKTFRKMWTAIKDDDWDTAAREAWDSKWRRDVGDGRAAHIVGMLRLDVWPQLNGG